MSGIIESLTYYLHSIAAWGWDQIKDHPWATAVAGLAVARMFGTVVETGWVGVLFSCGKVKSELQPGFHWLAPIIHHVRKVRIKSVSLDLPPQRIVTRDGLAYNVDANLVYHISDPRLAVTQIDDVHVGCRAMVPLAIANFLQKQDSAHLADRSRIDENLGDLVQTQVARWGVKVEHAGLRSIAPTSKTLRITQLSKRCEIRARLYHSMRLRGLASDELLVLLGSTTRLLEKSAAHYRGSRRRLAGRRELAAWSQAASAVFKVGDRVEADWWELGEYYPGVVVAVDRDHLKIKYDDGDEEKVNVRNIRREKPKGV